jgi:hypothetical protein
MQEVIDGVDPLGGQNFRKLWADSLYILNWGGGFEHLKGW